MNFLNPFDLIAGIFLLALLVGIGCYWCWAISNKDKAQIREFEDAKIDSKLEDE